MSNIGYATLSVIPSARGFGSALSRDVDPQMHAPGLSAGKVLGAGLLAGAAIVVAGIGAIIKTGVGEAMDASAGTAQLAAGIKSTGNAAGVSVDGINALASSIQKYSGQTDDSIVESAKLLLTFTNIKNSGADKIFDRATEATANMAAKMGGDAAGSAIQLGKALNDPIGGISSLARVGIQFTDAQKDTIKAMVEAGDIAGAQGVILGELETQFGGAAAAAGQSLPGQLEIAKRSFEDVSQAVVEGLLPVVLPGLTSIGDTITTKVIPAVTGFIQGFKDGEGPGGKFRDVLTSIYERGIKPIADFVVGTAVPAVSGFVDEFRNGEGPGGAFRDVLKDVYDNAIAPIATFVRDTAIPAVRDFVTGFQDGTGPGGEFRDILKKVYDEGIVPLAAFINDTALPALKSIEEWIFEKGIPALSSFKGWIVDNKDTIVIMAGIITTLLIPVFADMAAKAVASGVTQVGVWLTTKSTAAGSAASQFASHYVVVAGWVASAGAAIASGATTVAIWALYKIEAIKGAAVTVGALLATAGGWIASAATATASAVVMAAAWVIGLGPIAWIIAGIALLVGAFVLAYQKVGWFRDAVDAAWKWIKDAVSAVVDWFSTAVPAVFEWIKDAFLRYTPLGLIISHWDQIKGAVLGVVDWLRAAPAAAFAFIKDAFLQYTPLGIIISHWDGIKSAIGDAITGAITFVQEMPGRIVSALSNLGSLLYDSGKDLIQGLLNGAGSLLSKIGEFFLDKLPDFIKEPFKRALGINSPSKVFAGFGANIAQGVIVGVDSMQSKLEASMAGLVTVPDGPTLAGSRTASNINGRQASGGPQLVQYINPQPGMSETQVGDMSARAFERALVGVGR